MFVILESSAVGLMKETQDPDFPIAGVRASKELHEAVLAGQGNLLSYHAEWIRLSGVARRSSAAHSHAALCEGLRLMHQYDQIDTSSVAIGEHLCRWLIQIELGVERNPASPNFDGLDVLAGTSTLQDGRASTAKFQEWVSTRMKERASLWKQERLFQQERRLQRSKKSGGYGGDQKPDADGPSGSGGK